VEGTDANVVPASEEKALILKLVHQRKLKKRPLMEDLKMMRRRK